ncbi:hypothetical protein HHK36_015339 [Tetracentron sinense]|uniref:Uncharacterized protein n=1 Tax=Tetracentron sinense TaxID=13715 RepID=A0A834Z712_TETSI|nr:hypothetical protein HHK36_015339 [Tetracentron sinense]
MGTRKMFSFITHLNMVNQGSVNGFLYRKMVLFVSSCWLIALFVASFWFSFSIYMFYLLRFITKYLFRFQRDGNSRKDYPNCSTVLPHEQNQNISNCIEPEPEVIDIENSEYDGFGEKEIMPKFCFKFQNYEDTSRINGDTGDSVSTEMPPTTSSSKDQFMSGKDFSGFVEEPEILNSNPRDLFVDSNDGSFSNKEIFDGGFLSSEDFLQLKSEIETAHEIISQNSSYDCLSRDEEPEKPEPVPSIQDELSEKDELDSLVINLPGKVDIFAEVQFLSEKDFFALDSDPESISLSDEFSVSSHLIDSSGEEFLSEKDFGREFETDIMMDIDGDKLELTEEIQSLEETHLQNSCILDKEALNISTGASSVRKPFSHGPDYFDNEMELKEVFHNSEESCLQNSCIRDAEILTSDGLETLWEHQDLIEQLQMELRKVRATGLPTILEESESPKMMEGLTPWKIEEKFPHEDDIEELHQIYKSYREGMRKFDILNYQKMYAMGFLQSKDPLQSISSRKSTIMAIKSHLSQNIWLFKRQKPKADPMMKFIRELQSDLEMVYVGQVCLSWEFLHWQYEEAQELEESDPHGVHQYNQVAGEFQQFQVLMQRFIENEPFQGPRVQNYVKNRCVIRNLLQVPVIKEDCLKDIKKGRRRQRGDNAITSAMLTDIIGESIRIFWEFIQADKAEDNAILKGLWGTQVELQDPADSELLMDIRINLQKKEKKLKDILRSGQCILKRFQKNHEDRSDQVLCFFSQVDMKLVSRVLSMRRIRTDQLLWCHKKINKISFVDRKIHVEPSVLLFPC